MVMWWNREDDGGPARCDVCRKKLGKKDFYRLCRRCQPAYVKGREDMRDKLEAEIRSILRQD